MHKKNLALLTVAFVAAIVAVVWWRGRGGASKSAVAAEQPKVTIAPADVPARPSAPIADTPTIMEPAPPAQTTATPLPTPPQTQPVSLAPAPAPTPPTPPSPSSVPSTPIAEELSTRRMYAAHASLRAPEVADPDSESNRRILGTMIQKAVRPQVTSSKQP